MISLKSPRATWDDEENDRLCRTKLGSYYGRMPDRHNCLFGMDESQKGAHSSEQKVCFLCRGVLAYLLPRYHVITGSKIEYKYGLNSKKWVSMGAAGLHGAAVLEATGPNTLVHFCMAFPRGILLSAICYDKFNINNIFKGLQQNK